MTRGKYKAQAEARDRERAVLQVVKELDALAVERERHLQAVERFRIAEHAGAELRSLEDRRDGLVDGQRSTLQDEGDRLRSVLETVDAALLRMHRSWNRYADEILSQVPVGRLDKMKALSALLDVPGSIVENPYDTKYESAARTLIRQARGETREGVDEVLNAVRRKGHDPMDTVAEADRRNRSLGPNLGEILARPAPAEFAKGRRRDGRWVQVAPQQRATQICVDTLNAHPLSTNKTTAFVWYAATDWISEEMPEAPERSLRPDLGAICESHDVESWSSQQGFARWPEGAPSADECWKRDGSIAKTANRFEHAWAPSARFSRPGDATLLRFLYVQRATGVLVARTEQPVPVTAEIDDEATWAVPELQAAPLTHSYRLALATAIPFWMPPGETYAFANSEPLDDESIGGIELPFPDVLIVPAEPMRLEPTRRDAVVESDLNRLDRALLRYAGKDDRSNWQIPSASGWQVNLADALDVRGGVVEAILVRSNRSGGLADAFGWCVAIPHPDPRCGVLGRVVVPAFLSRSAHSDVVRQLAAAVAWADWRSPADIEKRTHGSIIDDSRFKDLERTGTAGGVHVLDATRTYSNTASDGMGDGVKVAPHLRRAHWRRARIGTRSDWEMHRSYRRTRIPPVVVNAGSVVPFSSQVYRLRPPKTTEISAAATPPSDSQ